MKKKSLILTTCVALVLTLGMAVTMVFGGTSPCGTSGPLVVTTPDPASYSYVQTSAGSTTASFKVSSPPIQQTGSCTGPPFVYGNGKSGADIAVNVSVSGVSIVSGPSSLTAAEEAALIGAFSFVPATFDLTDPGTGSQTVQLTFTNTGVVPLGTYDVSINIKPETGTGVGEPADKTFTVTVTAPVAVDTLPPDVSITSPTSGQKFFLNQPLHVEFTAKDPLESGAGTGVYAVRAFIGGCGEQFNEDITSQLTVSPALPVAADVTITAQADITAAWIGSFTLTAQADDNATPAIHTGEATATFDVGVNVATLPPIAVPNRQFKVGSTVPIKWKMTDYNGAFLAPYSDIKITIIPPAESGIPSEDRFAGDGADNIRWELDEFGKATQYITNYQIPVTGTYTVKVFVVSACGEDNYAEQESFTFFASTKGGKD